MLIDKKAKHILILFFLSSLFCCSQDKTKTVYNLDFSTTEIKDFKWNYVFMPFIRIDSTEEKINGRYPVCFEQAPHSPLSIFPSLKLSLLQQLFIPQTSHLSDTVQISIRNKCCNLSEAWLKFFCMDANDDLVYSDSININNDSSWVYEELSFPVAHTEKMLLGIYALGYDYPSPKLRKVQKLYLDRIGVSINNKNIEDYNYQPVIEKEVLNKKQIIELTLPEQNSFKQITVPSNTAIIGIGESSHGSQTMSEMEVQMMKNLIENHNCKLLLFESSIYPMLLANLYVQGKFSENDSILNEIAPYTGYSSTQFCNFMGWLRTYNETAVEKVHIYGTLDLDYNFRINNLFDYLYAFYNNQTGSVIHPLLELLYDRKFSLLKDTISSTPLEQILGAHNYSDFMYALTKAEDHYTRLDSLSLNRNVHQFFMRDYQMFELSEKYMHENIKSGETTCIVAHLGHVSKKGYDSPYFYSLGYFLNEKYKDSYSVIALFAGKGKIASFDVGDTLKQKPVVLNPPRGGSIESICSKIDLPCFYYPANNLSIGNYYYRQIGNAYTKQSEYWYGNLKSRIDGFIFSSESQAKDNPKSVNEFTFALDKIPIHASILNKMRQR